MALQTALRIPLRVQSINSHYHPLSFYEVRGLIEFFFRLSFSMGRPRLLIFQFYIKDPFSVRTTCATQCKLIHKKGPEISPKKSLGPKPSYPTISMMSTPASCACQSLDLKSKNHLDERHAFSACRMVADLCKTFKPACINWSTYFWKEKRMVENCRKLTHCLGYKKDQKSSG